MIESDGQEALRASGPALDEGRVASVLRGRTVVVTGFTGFLGKVFLALLLEECPATRVAVLIRRKARKEPSVRRFERAVDTSPVFRRLRALHGERLGAWLGERVEVIDADVEKPGCEIAPDALAALGRADLVVHCAGLTDFEPDPLKAVAVNVAGTQHVADLATRLGARLVHVSTAYVAGNGSRTVHETLEIGVSPSGTAFSPAAELRALQLAVRAAGDDLDARIAAGRARATALGWPNLYTYSKGLAEHLVGGRPGVTIVRPTIVECARTFPFPGWNEGINTAGPLAWLITTAFRRFPTAPHHRFDVIPVDDVARGLALIAAEVVEGRGGGVFHLGTSDVNPMTFGRCVELTGLGHRKWARRHGTAWQQAMGHLDPVPAPEEAHAGRGLGFAPALLARAHDLLGALAERGPSWGRLGEWLAPRVAEGQRRLDGWEADLDRIDRMLRMYEPFVHDNDYVFRTDRIRGLPGDPAIRWEVGQLDWREYWVDVEYPGLRRWCMPLLEGRRAPVDAPPAVPTRLTARVTA